MLLSGIQLSLSSLCLSRCLVDLVCNIYIDLRCTLAKISLGIRLFMKVFFTIVLFCNEVVLKIISALIFVLRIFISTELVLLPPKIFLSEYVVLLGQGLNFVVCSLINYLLTIDSIELVIVSIDYQLTHIK